MKILVTGGSGFLGAHLTAKLVKDSQDVSALGATPVRGDLESAGPLSLPAMDDRGSPIRNADETAPGCPHSFSGYIASKAQGVAAVLAAALRPSVSQKKLWRP